MPRCAGWWVAPSCTAGPRETRWGFGLGCATCRPTQKRSPAGGGGAGLVAGHRALPGAERVLFVTSERPYRSTPGKAICQGALSAALQAAM